MLFLNFVFFLYKILRFGNFQRLRLSDFLIIIADKCNKFITKDPPVPTMFQYNNVTIAPLKAGAD